MPSEYFGNMASVGREQQAMDRKEMGRILDEWMARGYVHLRATQRLPRGRNLLKSYLIEANVPDVGDDWEAVPRFLDECVAREQVTVDSTNDPTIHVLKFGQHEIEFFVDTIDPRFWLLHTTAPAQRSDAAVRNLVQKSPLLDAAWLPSFHLAAWSDELGSPRVLTAKFSVPTGLYQDDLPEEEFLDESLYLRIGSTGNALQRWNKFRQSEILEPSLALWTVRVARSQPDREDVVVEDLTAGGKLTCRGNSFRLHQEFLLGLRSRYSQLITGWEKRYRIGWIPTENAVRPTGSPAVISLPKVLDREALASLLGAMFSGGEPYRLYGVPVEQGDLRYVVRGVDLHTGDKIDFEITSETIRVYLFPTTCGNTLARLVTNLQHFHDARVHFE